VNNITGGIIYNKFVFELRYPVSLSPTATIYLLTFAEGGNNWNVLKDYNPYNLYKSAGIGVRVFMPAFGLLGVDYGYGFDTLPGQTSRSGGQFHFSIGQQIR
jgi:outer membrane protein insertion porin family